MKSALLTRNIVEQAVAILRPGIEEFIKQQKRVAAAMVVLNPLVGFETEGVILWEGTFGEQDKSKWPNGERFDLNARKKALVSLRTGLPTHLVQQNRPHMYIDGDFKYGGSAVFEGIITAMSGLAWEHDLMYSNAAASLCHGLCLHACNQQIKNEGKHIVGLEN